MGDTEVRALWLDQANAKLHQELAANDAEVAELRTRLAASEASDAESIAMYRKARDERDEARDCVRRLYSAAIDVVAVADRKTLIFDTMRSAISATPPHLR